MKAADIGKIRFAWAGGTKLGEAYYCRIQGPTFLMEAATPKTMTTTFTPLGVTSPVTSAATSSRSTSSSTIDFPTHEKRPY